MISFIDKTEILEKLIFIQEKQTSEEFAEYFCKNNYLDYINRFENINSNQEKALELLFNDSIEIIERCQKAIEINKTCFEAYFVLFYLSDSLNFYYDSLDINNTPIENYSEEYELNDTINIKLLISIYYSSINSHKQSIVILDEVEKFIGLKPLINRKLLNYSALEDYEGMSKIYDAGEFNNAANYIVYIICLLKNNKNIEARDVFDDMLSKYKYASYLSRPQELAEIKDEESKIMMEAVESCFETIESVPYFFSWISECVDSKNELPN